MFNRLKSRLINKVVIALADSKLGVRITSRYLSQVSDEEFESQVSNIKFNRQLVQNFNRTFSIHNQVLESLRYNFKFGISAAPAIRFSEADKGV